MQYLEANDVRSIAFEIVNSLGWGHIDLKRVRFLRSNGSRSTNVLARIHGLPKILQESLSLESHYVVEVIGEKYDLLSLEDKEKVIIHELLHIPKGFLGGLLPHKGWITSKKVEKVYKKFDQKRKEAK